MGKVTKMLLFLVLPLVVGLIAAFAFSNAKKEKQKVEFVVPSGNVFSRVTPTPYIISPDLPPLYPGIEWGEPQLIDEIVFRKESGELITLPGININSGSVKKYEESFFEYYTTQLKAKGWYEVDSASGPEGELYHYQSGNRYLTVGYNVSRNQYGTEGSITAYEYYIRYSQ